MSINNFWLFSILFNYFVNCGIFQNNKKHYKSFKNDTFKISFDITNNINSFLEEKDKINFNLVIESNNVTKLIEMKSTEIEMQLSNIELVNI